MIRLAAGALCAAVMILPANARDPDGRYANSPNAEWFKSQHNEAGQWCCDQSDGHPFYGDYKINDDGSVTIHDEGKEYKLPAHMVLKGANPTGAAVWWFTQNYHGERTSYCFAPGTLT
jgi:hypothetical protein